MMLDTRSTFDALIGRVSPDAATRERILNNRVYRHISDSFGGSQEYMATEQLYDIVSTEKYDLVVLDTPPVKNALDFLESPGRLVQFLDKRILSGFWLPTRKIASWGDSFVAHRRWFLSCLATFLGESSSMSWRSSCSSFAIFMMDFENAMKR